MPLEDVAHPRAFATTALERERERERRAERTEPLLACPVQVPDDGGLGASEDELSPPPGYARVVGRVPELVRPSLFCRQEPDQAIRR